MTGSDTDLPGETPELADELRRLGFSHNAAGLLQLETARLEQFAHIMAQARSRSHADRGAASVRGCNVWQCSERSRAWL